jgi:pyruvate formate lyase activating enzyme
MLNVFDVKRFAIHDGPGIRTTVFFKGCPLVCKWCHNPESISKNTQLMWHKNLCTACGMCISKCPNTYKTQEEMLRCNQLDQCETCVDACIENAMIKKGSKWQVKDLVDELLEDRDFFNASSGGITLSGGEPLNQGESLVELVESLKKKGVNLWLDTCGVDEFNVLPKLLPHLDGVLFDIKHAEEGKLKYWTNGSLKAILESLDVVIKSGVKIIVRWPLIGGVNDDDACIEEMIKLFKSSRIQHVNLLPYHTYGLEKWQKLNMKSDADSFYKVSDEVMNKIIKLCYDNEINCVVED